MTINPNPLDLLTAYQQSAVVAAACTSGCSTTAGTTHCRSRSSR
jgi:hypothetical protein